MLSKGQEWDWLGDPFWRVQTLLGLFVLGLGCLIFRELRIGNPVVNFRPLGERNLAVSCLIIFCAFGVLYGVSTSLPGLLQSLFGYDAYVSGLVQSPAGLGSILMLIVVGALLGRGTDARWLVAGGLLVMAAGCYWMALINLYISPWQVVWPRVVTICGLSMIFAPLNVAAFKYIPTHLRGQRSACSPCSATRGAASARPWPRPFRSGACSSTPRAWTNSSTRSTRT
jgi:DHA2 family multidrug resistance protein